MGMIFFRGNHVFQFNKRRLLDMAEEIKRSPCVDLKYEIIPVLKYYETHNMKEIGVRVKWMGGNQILIFVRERYFPGRKFGKIYMSMVSHSEPDIAQAKAYAEIFKSILEFLIHTRLGSAKGQVSVRPELEELKLSGVRPSHLRKYES